MPCAGQGGAIEDTEARTLDDADVGDAPVSFDAQAQIDLALPAIAPGEVGVAEAGMQGAGDHCAYRSAIGLG